MCTYVWTMGDVDDVPPISLFQSSPMFSSSLDEFKKNMIKTSESQDWPLRISNAGSDKEKLQDVLYSVLVHYWYIVSQTALKKNFINLSTSDAIEALVESLNDNEVGELKNLVQSRDWVGLINHRM